MQWFHVRWDRKCSVFVVIHHRKVINSVSIHFIALLINISFNCYYFDISGNDLARHLATCDRKSAYESSEEAQSNTVKCNMLDMLGLVRRDGEDEEDSSDGLLIPADQQQQLLSKSIERENENVNENEGENDSKTQPTSSQAPQPPNAIDDFNTQLSLDDLAPPQSVAPQPEPDRTPQLSDEYQVHY